MTAQASGKERAAGSPPPRVTTMANVAFICPQCGQTYEFAEHLAGKRGRCKVCQEVFRIPAPVPRPPAAPTSSTTNRPVAAASGPSAGSSTTWPPASSGPTRPADEGKIVFKCPTCGHGYRLAAKLAGKQGRCTACGGVFTIPAGPAPPVPADAPRPSPGPPPVRRPAARVPAAVPPADDDSEWWELDSSESIPADAVRAGAGRRRSAAAAGVAVAAVPAATDWTTFQQPEGDGDELTPRPRPTRPNWVAPAAIAGGVLVGVIALVVTFSMVSGTRGPSAPTDIADQPGAEPTKVAPPPEPVADTNAPGPESTPAPKPGSSAPEHRRVVEAVIGAYNEIADGYSRIRDADSIRQGSRQVARAAEQLRSMAQRGRTLPPLSPSEREELIRQNGPPLLQAVDRILGELRRLKETQGLRSDFDRLIDAYTRTRQEIEREVGAHQSG